MGRNRTRKEGSEQKKRRHESADSRNTDVEYQQLLKERIRHLEWGNERMRGASRSQSQDQTLSTRKMNIHPGDHLLIPVFDPNDEVTVEDGVANVDDAAAQFGWDGCSVLRLIVGRLRGQAKQWYDLRPRNATSWTDIKTELINNFRKPMPFAKLYKKAGAYETRPGQDLGEYCFNKIHALRKLKLDIPEEYLVDMVIDGVKDDSLAHTIRAAKITTASALHQHMMTLGVMSGKHERHHGKRDRPREEAGSSSAPEYCKHGDQKTEKKGKDKQNNLKCYKCGVEGHFARECYKYHDKNIKKGSNEINEVEEQRNPADNIYMCDLKINGQRVKGLIDTGSVCTLVRSTLVKRLDLTVFKEEERMLRGFAGGALIVSDYVKVEIKAKEAVATINAVVVPEMHLIYECVVGRDFLDQEHVILIKKGGELLIRQTGAGTEVLAVNGVEVLTDPTKELRMGTLNKQSRRGCERLLWKYNDCVSSTLRNLGKTDAACMEIKCVNDSPVVYRPYRLSEYERGVLRDIIQELLDNHIIRQSESPYASPVLLVTKKTRGYWMCVDFRKLNAITVKDKYPIPLIDDQIDKLGGYRYFTGLDLTSGYYQVPVDENSIAKTAFITPEGHYEFLRMPFGLTNAPAVFQRMVNKVLGMLKNNIAFPYIDDIIIPSSTVEEGMCRLQQVLERLREHHLTLNLSKCSFFESTIEYLGREINEEDVRPGKAKIEAVQKMREPQSVKQVRQFLGLSGYFRKFVKNYATIVAPLTQLLRKDVVWRWTTSQREAVEQIKHILTSRPVLTIFDSSRETELHTDASAQGVGDILLQRSSTGMTVVAYFSK